MAQIWRLIKRYGGKPASKDDMSTTWTKPPQSNLAAFHGTLTHLPKGAKYQRLAFSDAMTKNRNPTWENQKRTVRSIGGLALGRVDQTVCGHCRSPSSASQRSYLGVELELSLSRAMVTTAMNRPVFLAGIRTPAENIYICIYIYIYLPGSWKRKGTPKKAKKHMKRGTNSGQGIGCGSKKLKELDFRS